MPDQPHPTAARAAALRPMLIGALVALVAIVATLASGVTSARSQVPTFPPGDGEVATERLGGENRFETSVEISMFEFPDGADTVYLARADVFADALSGGALTGGPILLVHSCDTLPDVIRDEIERLSPSNVVALGGEAAVCEQVLQEAAEAASADSSESPSPSETTTEPSESPSPTTSPSPSETEDCPLGPLCPSETTSPSESPSPSETATSSEAPSS